MDFFEAQARAKKRTSRLVALFVLAVIGTILASYVAAIGILGLAGPRTHRRSSYYDSGYGNRSALDVTPWQPGVFVVVATGMLIVIAGASLYKWSEYSSGGSAVAEGLGGRRVDAHTTDTKERRLLNVVEEMAIASGIGVPVVYILDDEPGLNAFAAGLTTSDAVVTVTRGTLDKLSRDELQGVIGHEFSHILNGDMRLNMRLTALVFGILVLGLAGRGILWSLRNIRLRGKNSGGAIAVVLATGIALLIIGYVGYFFGRLIQAGVSRQREFLADASAVQFTRNPGGITGALKKIGGYALGSTILHNQGAAIGHFFFAQSFATGITGLWATHPPLDERIRAIDPQFDGKFFEPPELVDVTHASFAAAGFAPRALSVAESGPPPELRPTSLLRQRFDPAAVVATAGVLTPEQVSSAQSLLESTPPRLRAAAQAPSEALVLIFGLLLDRNDDIRDSQRATIASRAGGDALRTLDELEPGLGMLRDEHKLPLVQLALPVLKQLQPSMLDVFFETVDELVNADGKVSTFEFAVRKMMERTLQLHRSPQSAVIQYYSFQGMTEEISIVLSVLARASTADPASAAKAFAEGAAQLKLIEHELKFFDAATSGFAALNAALDRLAAASGPIKQRTLIAAAHVVSADGQVLVAEYELLRAIAASLDCPMPPVA
jgi:Zn-dependent protease with chaperone function